MHADGTAHHHAPPMSMLPYGRPPPSQAYALASTSTPPPPTMPDYTTNGGPDRHGRTQAPLPQDYPGEPQTRTSMSPDPGQELAPFPVEGGAGANHYPSAGSVPRLPPILQVEKQQVTSSATQIASANRRRNEAHFVCPVPGCGSTFTRRFNLRGHLRSHTEERPFVCTWPGCNKSFARQHDCKRHQALHQTDKAAANTCPGCKKTFSRLDALNRHRKILRSEGGAECKAAAEQGKQGQGPEIAAPTV